MPYFERLGESRFRPTEHVSGAWNPNEQHVAPALGLLAHLVEVDRDRRRDDGLVLSRLSYDILGTLPLADIEVAVTVLRPGRSIDLVQATLTHQGRTALLLRAWLMSQRDTTRFEGSDLAALPGPEQLPPWAPGEAWPGGFVASAEVRRSLDHPGRGRFWVRTDVPLLDEPVSKTARAAGLFDIANGMTIRADPQEVMFPNVDLTAHLYRQPDGEWLGFDTTVSFGPIGIGLTSAVVHDASGPFGVLAQTLTVRPVLAPGSQRTGGAQ